MAFAANGGSLEVTVSYIVDYAERTVMKDCLFTKIAGEIMNSDGPLQWASASCRASDASPTAALSQ
jgi:hypothetical protein